MWDNKNSMDIKIWCTPVGRRDVTGLGVIYTQAHGKYQGCRAARITCKEKGSF